MNIAFDVDGVLTDFEWFLNTYGDKYFSKKTRNVVTKIKPSSSVSERFGYPKEWDKKFYTRYLFWYVRKYSIRENVAEVIRKLRLQGHKIYFITARALAENENLLGNLMRDCLKRWLKKNCVEYDGIYFVSHQDASNEKANLCKKLNIDIFVEDEPTNIERLSKICKVICVSADYNQQVGNCLQAIDFGEVYRYITRCEKDVFQPLDYKEREMLGQTEKIEYFTKLKQYYEDIPFDEVYWEYCKKSIRKSLRRCRRIFSWGIRIRVSGEQFLNTHESTIFVCNHRSLLDVPICYCVLNKIMARFLTKKELEYSILGNWMKSLGIIFLNREDKKSGKAAQNLMIQTILNGGNVLMFPEGTRNRTTQSLLPFKMGAVYMAQVTQAPIVPLVICKKGNRHFVIVGDSIRVGVMDDLQKKNEILREKMAMMLEESAEQTNDVQK